MIESISLPKRPSASPTSRPIASPITQAIRPRLTTTLDCKHFFFVLAGRGVLHANDEVIELGPGDVAMIDENEVHWFENPHDEEFTFIELWVPAPSETVWVDPDDI